MDLARQRPHGFPLRRRNHLVERREDLFPTDEQIEGDNRNYDEKGEDRNQRAAIRPQNVQEVRAQMGAEARQFACRLLGFAQTLADDLMQPRPLDSGAKRNGLSEADFYVLAKLGKN